MLSVIIVHYRTPHLLHGLLLDWMETSGRDLVYSDCWRSRCIWTEAGYRAQGRKRRFCCQEFDRRRLRRNNFIPAITALFRRHLWERVGGFDPLLRIFEDWTSG